VNPAMTAAMAISVISGAMAELNYEQAIIDDVVKLLTENTDVLESGKQQVTHVPADWFGGAPTAHRIGTNAQMAHQAVEEEFQKLAESLLQYSQAVTTWGNEVVAVDADTNAEMTMRAASLEQVNALVDAATNEAADDRMGDGSYDEPAESTKGDDA